MRDVESMVPAFRGLTEFGIKKVEMTRPRAERTGRGKCANLIRRAIAAGLERLPAERVKP